MLNRRKTRLSISVKVPFDEFAHALRGTQRLFGRFGEAVRTLAMQLRRRSRRIGPKLKPAFRPAARSATSPNRIQLAADGSSDRMHAAPAPGRSATYWGGPLN